MIINKFLKAVAFGSLGQSLGFGFLYRSIIGIIGIIPEVRREGRRTSGAEH